VTVRRLLLTAATVWLTANAAMLAGWSPRDAVTPAAPVLAQATQNAVMTPADPVVEYRALLNQYCATCHNQRSRIPSATPLFLDDSVDLADLEADWETWEKVIRKLGVGAMPPQGLPHPGEERLTAFRDWLAGSLDAVAAANDDPGEFVLHRLNRTEYANAVRDLLGLEVDVTALLPPDSSEFGFDNIASVLQVTPALLERYLTAAMRISALAVGDPAVESTEFRQPVRLDFTQDSHVPGLPLGTRGGTVVRYNFPADGEYTLSASLFRPVDNADTGIEGQDSATTFEILIDSVPVHEGQIGGLEDHLASRENMTAAREAVAARMRTTVFVTAGPHDVGFTFVDRPGRSQDVYRPFLRSSQDIHVGSEEPKLVSVSIAGPAAATGVSETPSRARLFTCAPVAGAEAACAEEILSAFARRAYRRPVTEADVTPLMNFYEMGRAGGGSFDDGIRAALPRVLASPSFLFRSETSPEAAQVGAAHPISDLELASRLSFFLWSSIPDDELLTLAEQGRLREPGVLETQVRRMLADARAEALTVNFPDQWLALRNMERTVPDLLMFPDWDLNLREALRQETLLLFDDVVRNDRSAMDLLNADWTFMNERLARHYGIEGVYGSAFRRVTVDDPNRFGILGHASVLAMTSVATRTSPVFRGKWILTNILNVPPGLPPDDVPALEENTGAAAPRSVRERLEQHRANPVCASCHRNMDPIGFALENFDVTGQWRDLSEAGTPVDAAGILLDGTPIDGPVALREAIAARPEVFVGTVTEKLFIYALGRGLEPFDMPVVRDVVRTAADDDYRFQSIILGIVESRPFQNRTKLAPEGTQAAD
jgi:mono/diheme cytochrome c family protein